MKTNKNIIHRGSTKLLIKILKNTCFHKEGSILEVVKNEWNHWIDNKNYCFCVAHLRNENYIQILKQE